jgi:hypothetical protein
VALLPWFGYEFIAQCGDGPTQMSLDRARRDTEHVRGAVRVEVEERRRATT